MKLYNLRFLEAGGFLFLALISVSVAHGPGDSHKFEHLADLVAAATSGLASANPRPIPAGPITTRDNGGYDSSDPGKAIIFNPVNCSQFSATLFSEIQSYGPIVNQIIAAATTGSYKGQTYGNLSYFVDTFINRLSGTDELEDSIDFLRDQMVSMGFKNVKTEPVPNIPAWKRGSESAKMLSPKKKDISIIGLGGSAPTSILGLTASAVVFNSYDELVANKAKARNKIVVCNFGGPAAAPLDTANNGYADAVGAGALAMLYKSATTFSLYSPHARRANLYYGSTARKVPVAYLTIEDSQLLSRISGRGQSITLYLNMQNGNGTRTSRNLFGDLTGSSHPNKVVLVSGHTDNWDVGQGAQDDAFALAMSLQATSLLKSLGLAPKRTIRTAFWTSEEYGYLGSQRYIQDHKTELSNINVALEADYACLASVGLIFNGRYEMGCIIAEIMKLLAPSKASMGVTVQANIFRTDLDNFEDNGVPVVSLYGDDGRYYYFHHTNADTMTAVNSGTLDQCLATWAATAYILADLTNGVPSGFDEF